jgi:ATP-binding protein involved in chromosome partitioning
MLRNKSKSDSSELEAAVLAALDQVIEPGTGRSLAALNMIKDLQVKRGKAKFTIHLFISSHPNRDELVEEAEKAVLAVEGIKKADMQVTAEVIADGRERNLARAPIRNAIAVASGKGGVGKSTIAVNLAVTLAQGGATVGLLDADLYGPNLPTMLGLEHLPPTQSGLMVPAEAYGIKVISTGFMVPTDRPLILRGPMLHKAIQQFINEVDWGELDYLIVDLPPGTGDAPLSVAQLIPLSGGVIVTLPQQVSLDDARRGIEMFRKLDVPIFGVVENMSYLELPDGSRMDVFGTGGGERLAQEAAVPYIGSIPMDPAVREGGDSGKPVTAAMPESAVAQALKAVGQDVALSAALAALDQQRQNVIPIQMIG